MSYRISSLPFYFFDWQWVLYFLFFQPSCAYERVQTLDNAFDVYDCNDDNDNVDDAANEEDNGDGDGDEIDDD